ncbi:hypothetical protein GCM10010360_00100 [Streptomyces nogalater]
MITVLVAQSGDLQPREPQGVFRKGHLVHLSPALDDVMEDSSPPAIRARAADPLADSDQVRAGKAPLRALARRPWAVMPGT